MPQANPFATVSAQPDLPRPHESAGVDVSKLVLDVAGPGPGLPARVENAARALRGLARALVRAGVRVVGIEPTGGYERLAVEILAQAGLDVRLVCPWRLRQFAKARGCRAKSDPLDARMIHAFLCTHPTRSFPQPEPGLERLRAYVREAARVEADLRRLAQRARAASAPGLAPLVAAEQAALEASQAALEALIEAEIQADEALSRRAARLASAPGVGSKTVRLLLAEMPELGTLDPRHAAALAGLAPYTSQSGSSRKGAKVAGGRGAIRRGLFMTALASQRHNPWAKALYDGLRARGKPHKLATIALARRILLTLNAMIRTDQDWKNPTQTTPA